MAAELRRYGVPVRIIDKELQPSGQSRALFLWTRTLELFDHSGISAALIAKGQKVDSVSLQTGAKRIGRIELSEIDSTHPYALMLPQAETERVLTAHLATLGVQVERGTVLEGFTNGPDRVIAELRHADGKLETFQTPYLIGCDGGGSFVRKALGLSATGPAHQSDWLLADVRLEGFSSPRTELSSFWSEDGFFGIFPLPSGLYRVTAALHDVHGERPEQPTLAQVQAVVDARGPGGVTVSDPVWLSAFRVHEHNMSSYRAGRVFLAGDAAHMHNPVGAQGLNMGIHDAVNLAWKLALVCRGVANAEALLDSYNAERHALAEEVFTNISRAEMLTLLKNPTAQFARNVFGNIFFGLAPARKALAERLAEVSHAYRHSPINGIEDRALPGPGPGDRMVPHEGQPKFGIGDTPRFALFANSSPKVDALHKRFADLLEAELRPVLSPRCIWLVRPDGYVAAATLEDDVQQIEDYLRTYVPDSSTMAAM
jgi:2-polyprenyl-6-methoxyphenol hydroxylase-like FAD-dependent oxidoreductase